MDIDTIRKNNLKKLIKEKSADNKAQFSKKLSALSPKDKEISPSSISRFFIKSKNSRTITTKFSRRIEKAFNLEHGWMDTYHGYETTETDLKKHLIAETPSEFKRELPNKNTAPLISWVQAGELCATIDNYAPGDAEEWIGTSKQYSKSAFALRVNGDSMTNPQSSTSITHGSIIIVDPEIQYENGYIVVAKFGEGEQEATLKKYVIEPPNRYLEPLNQKYDPIKITEDCIIIGVVTETINRLI